MGKRRFGGISLRAPAAILDSVGKIVNNPIDKIFDTKRWRHNKEEA